MALIEEVRLQALREEIKYSCLIRKNPITRNCSSKAFSIDQPKLSVLCWVDYKQFSFSKCRLYKSQSSDLLNKKRTEFFTDQWIC